MSEVEQEGGWTYQGEVEAAERNIEQAMTDIDSAAAMSSVSRAVVMQFESGRYASLTIDDLVTLTGSETWQQAVDKLRAGAELADGLITAREARINNGLAQAEWAKSHLPVDEPENFSAAEADVV